MTIARTVSNYLSDQAVKYQVIEHAHTTRSSETARAANVREDSVAKAILLKDELGYVLAVIPASSSLDMRALHDESGRNQLEMVPEDELQTVFSDCELGALPPIGQAYGIPTYLDSSLRHQDSVHLEAGDHQGLIKLDQQTFSRLFEHCQSADLSRDWP